MKRGSGRPVDDKVISECGYESLKPPQTRPRSPPRRSIKVTDLLILCGNVLTAQQPRLSSTVNGPPAWTSPSQPCLHGITQSACNSCNHSGYPSTNTSGYSTYYPCPQPHLQGMKHSTYKRPESPRRNAGGYSTHHPSHLQGMRHSTYKKPGSSKRNAGGYSGGGGCSSGSSSSPPYQSGSLSMIADGYWTCCSSSQPYLQGMIQSSCRFCNHKRCPKCRQEPYNQSTRQRYEDAIKQECKKCGHPKCVSDRRAGAQKTLQPYSNSKAYSPRRQECQWCGHEKCVPCRRGTPKAVQSSSFTNANSSRSSSPPSTSSSGASSYHSFAQGHDLHGPTHLDCSNQTAVAGPSSSVPSNTNSANAM